MIPRLPSPVTTVSVGEAIPIISEPRPISPYPSPVFTAPTTTPTISPFYMTPTLSPTTEPLGAPDITSPIVAAAPEVQPIEAEAPEDVELAQEIAAIKAFRF